MKQAWFIGLSLNFCLSSAQVGTDTLRLFYDINQEVSTVNIQRVDSLLQRSQKVSVYITGYADFLALPAYNFNLSTRRALAIRRHIEENHQAKLVNLTSRGLGENRSTDNGSTSGEPFQRRVDVVVRHELTRENKQKNISKVPHVVQEPPRKIETLETGESARLEGLSFVPGYHMILDESQPVLDQLLKTLEEHPNLEIEIQGHVCCVPGGGDGPDLGTGDQQLSENRARFVYDHLVEHGINPDRLTYKGYGHSRPKYKVENTPEEEQGNRRVEIKVTKK